MISKLRELEELGIKVVLATGNILCIAKAASIFMGATGPIIAENGGVVMNRETDEIRYVGNIDEIEKAFRHLSKKLKVAKVSSSEMRRTEIAIYRDVEVERLRDVLRGFPVSIVDTKFAIHVKDPMVNKGRALAMVADMLGISLDDVVAIGDSEGDREMIEVAGYGISVGEESLRGVCDYITKGKYGEGGSEALEIVLKMVREER
ncbi:MAG: phosphoglycolate phosphatase [Candidatus Hydrothermarchaeaceae archaeon]